MSHILVVDNYDSFVYNVVQYLTEIGASCTVLRNDDVQPHQAADYDGVLISPGPGKPEDAGVSVAMIAYCGENSIPLFGICLGLQAIAHTYGAKVSQAPELVHGRTSQVIHDGGDIFNGIPSPFTATRYHSLAVEVESIPDQLQVIGRTPDGVVMALHHKTLPISGVQFHPESVLTEYGYQLLANWLVICGDSDAPKRALEVVGVKAVIQE